MPFLEIKVDIDDGPSIEITKDGPRAVRIARVFGVLGSGAARLLNALHAPRVPRYGYFHPVLRDLPLSRIHAALEPGSTDIVTVTCEYFYPTGGNQHFGNAYGVRDAITPQLEIVSTVQSATTQFYLDDEGNKHQIVLPYSRFPPEGEEGPPQVMPLQSGTVEYQLPMTIFRYMRREVAATWVEGDYVGDRARKYVHSINSVAIFGEGGPHFWMCTRLDGVSDDAGVTYNVTYEFQRHPDTWNPVVIYVDPDTQLPVTDADVLPDGLNVVNGIGRFRIYPERDFTQLALTI